MATFKIIFRTAKLPKSPIEFLLRTATAGNINSEQEFFEVDKPVLNENSEQSIKKVGNLIIRSVILRG